MEGKTVVVVDAMGGDLAPVEIVKGAVEAVQKNDRVQVILTGIEEQVRAWGIPCISPWSAAQCCCFPPGCRTGGSGQRPLAIRLPCLPP